MFHMFPLNLFLVDFLIENLDLLFQSFDFTVLSGDYLVLTGKVTLNYSNEVLLRQSELVLCSLSLAFNF